MQAAAQGSRQRITARGDRPWEQPFAGGFRSLGVGVGIGIASALWASGWKHVKAGDVGVPFDQVGTGPKRSRARFV